MKKLIIALTLPAVMFMAGIQSNLLNAGEVKKEGLDVLFPEKLYNAEGKEVSRESLKGKIVGVYFSAKWCPPCRGFTPSLVKFRDANKEKFEIVFVSADRDEAAQKDYMTSYKMNWPAFKNQSDAGKKLSEKFAVRGIPTLVIVDAKGKTITKDGRGDVTADPAGALAKWKKSAKG